jgi:hypothetical protein
MGLEGAGAPCTLLLESWPDTTTSVLLLRFRFVVPRFLLVVFFGVFGVGTAATAVFVFAGCLVGFLSSTPDTEASLSESSSDELANGFYIARRRLT